MRTVLKLAVVVAVFLLLVVPAAASQSLEVTVEVDTLFGEPASPFIAYGSAVDAGLLCPSGTVSDLSSIGSGPPSIARQNFHAVKIFECEDGSGSFTVHLNAHVIFDPYSNVGRWNVLDGTGAYAKLHGTGSLEGMPTDTGVLDIYSGSVHID